MLRIVHISDTHGLHEDVKLPDGQVLVHTGDFTGSGSEAEAKRFMDWFMKQRHTYKILVAGNHDCGFDAGNNKGVKPLWVNSMISRFTEKSTVNHYLEHSSCNIWGMKFFGSPYTPNIVAGKKDPRFGFLYDRNEGSVYWADIPKDTDVLLTHTPPSGKMDWAHANKYAPAGPAGCEALRYFVQQVKPQLHLFGHVHESYGSCMDEHTIYSNGCQFYRTTEKVKRPAVFDIDEFEIKPAELVSNHYTQDCPF